MGGTRNLKLGDDGQGTGAKKFFSVGQMSILFSCCVHQKDVARFRALLGWSRGSFPP